MKIVKNIAIIILLLGVITAFCLGALYRARLEPVSGTQYIMGTLIEITAYGNNVEPAVKAAFERMREIELQIGQAETSDISMINMQAGGTAVRVGDDTWHMIKMAKEYWSISDKAFDVTVGPLVNAWGFDYGGEGRFATPREVAAALPKVGSDKLFLNTNEKTIRLAQVGMAITVGGIAKGYAVEEAVKVLKQRGVKNAIVNGGGSSIKVIGSGPPGRGWRVGIEDPRHPGKLLGVIHLKSGQSLGTSADDRRYFIKEGHRYSHIIDPRTGYPADKNIAQVTIVTDEATKADIFTKALFLNDISWSLSFLKRERLQAMIVKTNGEVIMTSGLRLDN